MTLSSPIILKAESLFRVQNNKMKTTKEDTLNDVKLIERYYEIMLQRNGIIKNVITKDDPGV